MTHGFRPPPQLFTILITGLSRFSLQPLPLAGGFSGPFWWQRGLQETNDEEDKLLVNSACVVRTIYPEKGQPALLKYGQAGKSRICQPVRRPCQLVTRTLVAQLGIS